MTGALHRLNDRIDDWLAAPVPGAAGRLGVFRVVYAAFYLWFLEPYHLAVVADVPAQHWTPAALMRLFTDGPPSATTLTMIEAGLVAALVLLMVGLFTRVATVAVLLLGSTYWLAWAPSLRHGYEVVLLGFHIPLLMAISTWGRTLSLDAWRSRRSGRATTAITDGSMQHAWPIRVNLIVLSVLFGTAAYLKVRGGAFLVEPDYIQNVFARYTVRAEQAGLFRTPLRAWLAEQAWLSMPAAWGIVVFEASVWIALLSRRIEPIVIAMALLFNAVNALLLGVTFNGVVVIYALFVDWPAVGRRLCIDRLPRPRWIDWLPVVPTCIAVAAIAAMYAYAWDHTRAARLVPTLGGLVDEWTIWWLLTPAGLIGLAIAVAGLRRRSPDAAITSAA